MCALPANSNNPSRHRRCKDCGHLNAPSFLVCQNCSHVLSGSEWVNVPPQVDFTQVDEARNVLLEREADIESRSTSESGTDDANPYETRLDPIPDLVSAEGTSPEAGLLTHNLAPKKKTTRHGKKVSAVLVDATQQLIKLSEVNLMETRRVGMPSGLIDSSGNISTIGTTIFDNNVILCIDIGSDETPPIVLRLPQKRAIIMGRQDPKAGQDPDIDLVPYGAYQSGISRRHASLELNGKRLLVRDLESSNGTYLNGDLLDAHESHQIRDGDTVHLGKLKMKITFRK